MKDFKKLWDQAKVQAKASNGDVFEIYAQLSGAQIVSKYKSEIAEKLKKAGYKFHLDDKFLYLTPLSGKSKIIPIYNPEYRHIFSEAEIIVENKNSFWLFPSIKRRTLNLQERLTPCRDGQVILRDDQIILSTYKVKQGCLHDMRSYLHGCIVTVLIGIHLYCSIILVDGQFSTVFIL